MALEKITDKNDTVNVSSAVRITHLARKSVQTYY